MKRYNPYRNPDYLSTCLMTESKEGEYVKYSDFVKVTAEEYRQWEIAQDKAVNFEISLSNYKAYNFMLSVLLIVSVFKEQKEMTIDLYIHIVACVLFTSFTLICFTCAIWFASWLYDDIIEKRKWRNRK